MRGNTNEYTGDFGDDAPYRGTHDEELWDDIFDWPSIKQRPKRKLFSNTTRLYFLLAILATTAAFATLFFWPAAFAAATTALTAAAALTVFGVTPLAFLAGLSVLATAAAAAAIVFTAAVALYLGAKLTVAALKLTVRIIESLFHKIFHKIDDMMNPPVVIDNYNDLKAAADRGRGRFNTSSFNSTRSDIADSNILDENEVVEDTTSKIYIPAILLMALFESTVNKETLVAKRSNPNEHKSLNANKVKLMTEKGEKINYSTRISCTESIHSRAIQSQDPKDILSLVEGSGYGFFRTFNPNADGSPSSKQPIPVKLV